DDPETFRVPGLQPLGERLRPLAHGRLELGDLHSGVDTVGQLVHGAGQVEPRLGDLGLELVHGGLGGLTAAGVAHCSNPFFTASTSSLRPSWGAGTYFSDSSSFFLPSNARIAIITTSTPATMRAAAQAGSQIARTSTNAASRTLTRYSPTTPAAAKKPAPTPRFLPFSVAWAMASWISLRTSVVSCCDNAATSSPIVRSRAGRVVDAVVGGTVLSVPLVDVVTRSPPRGAWAPGLPARHVLLVVERDQ